jgi:hypothetical protein
LRSSPNPRQWAWAVGALGLLLGACADPPPASAVQAAKTAPASAQSVLAPAVQPLTIGPGGAMGLTTAAPFTVEAVRAAFGDLEAVAGQTVIDRRVTPVIQVRSDGLVLYEIYAAPGGRVVGRVTTRSPAVAGPRDEVIGATRQRDLPSDLVAACAIESISGERRQICPDPGDGRFVRVFRPQQALELPREGAARLEAVAGGDVLMEMQWTSAAQARP